MGNCLAILFGRRKRPRNYFSGRYKNYDVGVEFDNLIEDEADVDNNREVLTARERDHLTNKRFSQLVEEQRLVDAEIDAELHQEEERTRLEEETYNAAKREAARISKQSKLLEQKKKTMSNGSVKSWAGDDRDWSMANEEEDFDSFLKTVKARSENVRATVASLSTANKHSTHSSLTNNSSVISVDLFCEEDTGIAGVTGSKASHIPEETTSSRKLDPFNSISSQSFFSSEKNDSDWEADFVSAEMESSTAPFYDGNEGIITGGGGGDASSNANQNGRLKDHNVDQVKRETIEKSFSITEDDDEEILNIISSNSSHEGTTSTASIIDVSAPKTSKLEALGFDIDIDKFLEELDAEL